ncbi:hypothetical protein HU200_017962 [Digitaria exilis]|uniref:Protein EARLY RESPONSIVE TO DEHYDRATION 15 n=1 Tax=Digitaria exilis TaxID=1010633 RepID=A0A835F571_9POAL|nr:hypothetical protein HU200_017962 [Digitaria exilis]
MSAVAVSASSLNPDAPLFIPASLLQVEDFSPQWWDLVTTTAWFRDHWSREHAQLDEMAEELDAAGLLPDDDLPEDNPAVVEAPQETAPAVILKTGTDLSRLFRFVLQIRDMNCGDLIFVPRVPFFFPCADEVFKALNLTSPKGGEAPRAFWEKPRHGDKPTKYAGSPKGSSAPRVIHQPR